MKRKGIWVVVVLLVATLVVLNLVSKKADTPTDVSEQPAVVETEPTPITFTFATSTKTIQHGDYGVRFDFPAFTNEAVHTTVLSVVEEEVSSFEQDVAEFGPSIFPDREYTLIGSFEVHEAEQYVTVVLLISTDTGGAHPNHRYRTLTFDVYGKQVAFDQVLGSLFGESMTLQDVSTYTQNALEKELGEDAASSGWIADGTAPAVTSFEDFYVTDTSLVLLFEPYAIGPYAWSSREVAIPFATSTIANESEAL